MQFFCVSTHSCKKYTVEKQQLDRKEAAQHALQIL